MSYVMIKFAFKLLNLKGRGSLHLYIILWAIAVHLKSDLDGYLLNRRINVTKTFSTGFILPGQQTRIWVAQSMGRTQLDTSSKRREFRF